MKMKRALWLCLCGLLCACAHADTAATSAAEKEPSALNLRKEPDQNPRSLRLDDGVKAPQHLKQQPGDDDGEEKDKLPGGAVGNKNQPVVIDAVETPLEKSASRPIHRVYDPVSGLFCELVGDCHACPVSEKVCCCLSLSARLRCRWSAYADCVHVYRTKCTAARRAIARRCGARARRRTRRQAMTPLASRRSDFRRACRSRRRTRS